MDKVNENYTKEFMFFKVDDDYQSYLDKESGNPYRFIRNIDEGGHTKDIQIEFDHDENKALVHDKKRKAKSTHEIKLNTQDMISSFYYLRNNIDEKDLVIGKEFKINMFLII